MSILPDYKNMPLKEYSTIEEITERMSKVKSRPNHKMTPEEMLDMANKMESGTYKGHINYMMSREETIKALRKRAYEILGKQQTISKWKQRIIFFLFLAFFIFIFKIFISTI